MVEDELCEKVVHVRPLCDCWTDHHVIVGQSIR